MDQFLEKFNLPKLIQIETDNLNRPVHIKATKPIINNLSKRKHQAQMVSVVKSNKHLNDTTLL